MDTLPAGASAPPARPHEPETPDPEMLRLAASLEDGPLKRAVLGAAWRPPPPEAPDEARGRYEARLEFTGTGREYFRIWIVHTLLSLLTLGIYSAWAKVRKARWFAQNTRLLDSAFDFDADPRRVLAGRVLALALLLAYSHAFDWSATAGWLVYAALVLVGPWLFAGAQRFRLQCTRWRGLRFGFHASATTVYATCVPLIVVWTLSSVLGRAGVGTTYGWPAMLIGATVVTLLLLPLMHARLKGLQHRHARFGALRFAFEPRTERMYLIWATAVFIAIVASTLCALVGGLATAVLHEGAKAGTPLWLPLIGLAAGVLATYALAWPYFAARMQQVVWDSTRCGPLNFRGEMSAGPLMRLVLRNMLFTALSLGLYWPFAAVALARYRVGSMVVCCDEPWPVVQAAVRGRAGGASGDASAEAFGLDLGW